MEEIFESIDNRDIAVIFWVLLLVGWLSIKPAMRKSLADLWDALTDQKILIAFLLAAAITAFLCYCLKIAGLWTISQLKGTVVWFVAACIPSMMDIPKLSEDFSFFKKAALKSFGLSVFVEFYLNLFKAPLLVELIVVPLVVMLTCMLVLSEGRKDLKQAHGFIVNMLGLFGVVWILFQANKIFTSFSEIKNMKTIRDFTLPIALNLAFLPFLAIYAIYAAYDSIFSRLQFIVKNPDLRRFTMFALILLCSLNYTRAHRWSRRAWHADLNNRSAIWKSISER